MIKDSLKANAATDIAAIDSADDKEELADKKEEKKWKKKKKKDKKEKKENSKTYIFHNGKLQKFV